jgi:hypothetical protein
MKISNCISRATLFASLLFASSALVAQTLQAASMTPELQLPNAPGRTAVGSSDLSPAQTVSGNSTIFGTVLDSSEALVPGAHVTLSTVGGEQRATTIADSAAEFTFNDLPAGAYHVTVVAPGLVTFVSKDIVVDAAQRQEIPQILLAAGASIDVEVIATRKELAQDQVRIEEKQRAFGFFPNFYVVYDPYFVPLTAGMKFKLAFKSVTDPVTFGAAVFIAGIDQAADTPSYVQGAKGFGQRVGAAYANGATDILLGGAILPSLLHQDPRYFYQGTGDKKSRALHAISSPFIAKGDNGRAQFNYSSIGGDLGAAALSNVYYPNRDRGAGLVFSNALITTGGRIANALAQEFILRKFTKAKE